MQLAHRLGRAALAYGRFRRCLASRASAAALARVAALVRLPAWRLAVWCRAAAPAWGPAISECSLATMKSVSHRFSAPGFQARSELHRCTSSAAGWI